MYTNDKASRIRTEYFLLGFLLLTILPFLVLNYFNNPTAEDFVYGEDMRDMGFVNSQRVLYKYWGGRFFTYIWLSINPLFFKSIACYKLTTLVLMLVFIYVLFVFISVTTKNSLDSKGKLFIFVSILFLYLYGMPSVGQGFYWYGSVVCYHFSIMLLLLFIILYSRLSSETNYRRKILYTIICCLIAIATAGSSEIAAALLLMIIFLLMIKSFFINKKLNWKLLLIALSTVISVYIAFTFPGNKGRANQYAQNHQLFFSIYESFAFLGEQLMQWILNTPLLPLTILLIPVFSKMVIRKTYPGLFSIKPFYLLIVWFVFVFSGIFIMFWSSGIAPYDRILNLIYFVFLIGWFYNTVILLSYIKKKYLVDVSKIPKYIFAMAIIMLIISFFRDNNIKTAYTELLNGDAHKYDVQVNERYNFIIQSSLVNIELDSIKNIPKSFFYMDITSDPKIFYNRGYSRYFNKDSIALKKPN